MEDDIIVLNARGGGAMGEETPRSRWGQGWEGAAKQTNTEARVLRVSNLYNSNYLLLLAFITTVCM